MLTLLETGTKCLCIFQAGESSRDKSTSQNITKVRCREGEVKCMAIGSSVVFAAGGRRLLFGAFSCTNPYEHVKMSSSYTECVNIYSSVASYVAISQKV